MPDKALILGVNAYENVSKLRGCANDAKNVARLMTETFGFEVDNVHLLLDEQVRKARVKSEIQWLFEGATVGDRLAFHFSGHGSQVADVDGDEDGDALDELICLVDMDFSRSSTFITDDELGRLFKKCPAGALLTVFLDCCHSGSGTRKLIPPGAVVADAKSPRLIEAATAARVVQSQFETRRAVERWTLDDLNSLARNVLDAPPREQVLARYVDPPSNMVERVERIRAARTLDPKNNAFGVVAKLNHVLLAACQDHETAADAFIRDGYHGAFTFYLTQALRETGQEMDRSALVRRVTDLLRADRFDQQPRLEAASLSGAIFASGEPVPPPSSSATPPPAPTPPTPPTPPPATATNPPVARPSSPLDVDDGTALFHSLHATYDELLATYNRLIDLIQPSRTAVVPAAPRAEERCIVYVHGIGPHGRGYSDGWWNALRPYAASLLPGDLATRVDPPDGNRHEVIWSDLVNRPRSLGEPVDIEEANLAAAIREEYDERRRFLNEASSAVAPLLDESLITAGGDAREAADSRFIGNIDDFARYMSDADLRAKVLERFARVVRPLLQRGASVEIVAHSWGSVVAYEGLRALDGLSNFPANVRHLFTCGAALAFRTVRANLFGRVGDGRLPRVVKRWVNLNARGDVVGGRLSDRNYAVHDDFVDLEPVGCWPFPLNPVCSHLSYFVANNVAVNKNILGGFIAGT